MPPRITVTHESGTGRNERFHDNFTGADMTRNQFVRQINQGNYENYMLEILMVSQHLFLIQIEIETTTSVNQ